MSYGSVREFDAEEGYGYIHPADGHPDLPFFVAADDAAGNVLRGGEHVKFEVIHGPKGPEAADVQVT